MLPYQRNKHDHRELPRLLAELDHEEEQFPDGSSAMEIFQIDYSVYINGYRVEGSIFHTGHCTDCNHVLIFDFHFDGSFCPSCNKWTYSVCDDPECEICKSRPSAPLPDANGDPYYPERERLWDINFITD